MEKISREDAFILWLISLNVNDPWRILSYYGTAEAAFRAGFGKGTPECIRKVVSQTQHHLQSGMTFLSYKNAKYPARLSVAPHKPLGIFVIGDLPRDDVPSVAIVGARDNTHYGGRVAYNLAKELAAMGIVIVSGMARGLDARAHEGALSVKGKTAAVLAGGADVCYPSENFQLYTCIKEQGCVISERLPGTKAEKWAFPARNRIISAMADVLVVVEAAERSGTSHTANHALDQGKEVFAVPGRVTDVLSVGTNMLIKQGAFVFTSHYDVLFALTQMRHLQEFFAKAQQPLSLDKPNEVLPQKLSLASDEALVYACISHKAVNADYLAYKTGLKIAKLNTILLSMELSGQVKRLPGGSYIKS